MVNGGALTQRKRNRLRNVLVAIGVGLVAATLFLALAIPIFELVIGDCKPGEQDGQCGLGTFVAYVLAFGSAVIFWPIASTVFFRKFLR